MGHFGSAVKVKGKTPEQWLKTGAAVGEMVNGWSGRGDLVAFIGSEAGGATALYNPTTAEVEVNTDVAFGEKITPKQVGDITSRDTQYEFAKATGAIFHEAMHAKFTQWDLMKAAKELTPNENKALHLLEESRIEGHGVRHMPRMRHFLRACALEIVIGDMDEATKGLSNTRAAAHLAALSIARADAGVLERDDILAVAEKAESILGADLVDQMREIWTEFQGIRRCTEPSDIEQMYDLARRWNKLIQEEAEKRGEGAERPDGNGHEGDGSGAMSDAMKELMEALGEDADATSIASGDALGDQEKAERYAESASEKRKETEEKERLDRECKRVFKNTNTPSEGGSHSRVVRRRQPEAAERRAAVTIARALENARYRDRVRTETKSVTPPGRLRTRAIVQANALRDKGVMQETEPWRKIMRKHVDDPDLTLGVMVDISGSMGGAMEPMASAAWILSESVKRIQGRAAMVYYGNGVFPTLRPGQHLKEVTVYDANDGTEEFQRAADALDGALDLTYGTGARLVVVVSDGQYRPDQRENVQKWLTKMERAGVGVLWLGYGYSEQAQNYCAKRSNAEFLASTGAPADDALRIGAAAAKALTAAGARRG